MTCPASIQLENVIGLEHELSFTYPSATGGAAPVAVTCARPATSIYPLGVSTVNCTATDAGGRTAACSFTVTVSHRPLPLTSYLAFGDSLTAGENGRPVNFVPFIDLPNAYPTFLQGFFAERIPGQQLTLTNAGLPGERVSDNDRRLKDTMASTRAQVVLLLEGINDLNGGASPQTVANALRDSIRTARDRGAQYVFISTLLPVAPENCGPPAPRCRGFDTPPGAITATNDRLRSIVPGVEGRLVDTYDLFNRNRSTFIDVDGLHLRPEGNRALAEAFWSAIVQTIPAPQLRGF